ncbi:hypothetical protein B0H14DRAFT_3607388 [Mycena olivaceomarginata]|nr:hypothetical protein B0H14DRAFT_3607388 [Mycena olivaceomarginata]
MSDIIGQERKKTTAKAPAVEHKGVSEEASAELRKLREQDQDSLVQATSEESKVKEGPGTRSWTVDAQEIGEKLWLPAKEDGVTNAQNTGIVLTASSHPSRLPSKINTSRRTLLLIRLSWLRKNPMVSRSESSSLQPRDALRLQVMAVFSSASDFLAKVLGMSATVQTGLHRNFSDLILPVSHSHRNTVPTRGSGWVPADLYA